MMIGLCVAPIVEGHGEVGCIRGLLDRIWREVLGGDYLEVLQPIRCPKSRLIRKHELLRAVELAVAKLRGAQLGDVPKMVLVLIDADEDAPCVLGPEMQRQVKETGGGLGVACVVANVEYETWFVAAAESLTRYLSLAEEEPIPDKPEEQRCGKRWIQDHFREVRYSETLHQPRMTAAMDLALARSRSPSLDKLCRELARWKEPA
jgi:hypothetical protein